ncbi:MAG: hypothetical protein PPP58_02600 [Natronomonas sp.]
MDPFGDDNWPDEPEEFDPDSLGPSAPSSEPEIDAEAIEEAPDGLFRAFVGAAVMLNIALFAISLGVMLLYFRGDVDTGGASILIGLLAGVFAARYYVGFKRGTFTDDQQSTDHSADRSETTLSADEQTTQETK